MYLRLQIVGLIALVLAVQAVAQTAPSKTLVSVPVTVLDKKGRNVSGLKEKDFNFFRDDVHSKIEFFAGANEPISILLLIDTSPSAAEATVEIKKAALNQIQKLNENDRMQIVTFDKGIRTRSPLTSNRIILEQAIRGSDAALDEGSAMRDGLSNVLRGDFGQMAGRKAVIVMTDGIDIGSQLSKDELFLDIEESDAVIYTIYFVTKLGNFGNSRSTGSSTTPVNPFPQQRATTISTNAPNAGNARKYLEQISDATGGFYSSNEAKDLTPRLDQIVADIRSQYRLGFYLSEDSKPGDTQKLRVTVDIGKTQIRSRQKYRVR